MRTFSLCLAVLLGGVMLFMAGAGFAADYLAYFWPTDFGKRTDDYRFGYMAGVMDTVIYTQAVGVPGARLNSAFACVRNTKGLNAGQVVQTVGAQLGSNPKDVDTVAAAVIMALDACKIASPAGTVVNPGNTLVKR